MGLGNPGKKYLNNRHNIGYMVLDRLVETKALNFRRSLSWGAKIARVKIKGETVLFVKPLTFMNNSGRCVKKFYEKYNLDFQNILAVYDDVDLDLGRIKFRIKGSSAGHKGMDSIMDALGTDQIHRIKIGIGKPQEGNEDLVDYVLSDFDQDQIKVLKRLIPKAAECCWDWIDKSPDFLMRKYNP